MNPALAITPDNLVARLFVEPVIDRAIAYEDAAAEADLGAEGAAGGVAHARIRVAPPLIPLALKAKTARRYAFRTVSELRIRYRNSPLSLNGPDSPRRGPMAGDRLPDATVVHDGRSSSLHDAVATPGWHLLLCGPIDAWPREVSQVGHGYSDGLLTVPWSVVAPLG